MEQELGEGLSIAFTGNEFVLTQKDNGEVLSEITLSPERWNGLVDFAQKALGVPDETSNEE